MNRTALVISTLLLSSIGFADIGPGPAPRPPRPPTPEPTAADQFAVRARQRGFEFRAPAGFREVAVVPNPEVAYDYAVTDEAGRLEVRYALRPFGAAQPQPAQRSVDPASSGRAHFAAMVSRLTGGGFIQPKQIQPDMARELVGADGGLMATIAPRDDSKFGAGWKHVMVVQFDRRDRGYLIVFLLFHDARDLPAEGLAFPPLRALRVAPADEPVRPRPLPPT